MKKHFEPTRTEAALLELLRGHIWQRPLEESYFEGLTADDWQSVYTLSCRQGVQGLACTAARTLPAALQPPAATLLPWIAGTRQIVAENQRKRQVWADLQELLRSHGLEPVLLKGFTISQYYPEPDLREFGDLDIWVPGKADEVDELMRGMGRNVEYSGGKHSHIIYQLTTIENHHTLLDYTGPQQTDNQVIEATLYRCWAMGDNATLQVMFNERHLMTHLENRFILRQIIDWYHLSLHYFESYENQLYRSILSRTTMGFGHAILYKICNFTFPDNRISHIYNTEIDISANTLRYYFEIDSDRVHHNKNPWLRRFRRYLTGARPHYLMTGERPFHWIVSQFWKYCKKHHTFNFNH